MRQSMRWLAAGYLLVAAGCGSRNPPSTDASASRCAGQQAVIVTNDWNEAVDIYARIGDNARANLLGTVQPGERAEFGLRQGTRNVTAAPSRPIQPSFTPPAMRSLVRFRYVCR